MLKALADETRLDVIRQLMTGAKHVGVLNHEMQVEPTLLSHHLKVLREAGIVEAERDGKAVLYRLSLQVDSGRRGKTINLGCCKISFD